MKRPAEEVLIAAVLGAFASSLLSAPQSSPRGALFIAVALVPPALAWALAAQIVAPLLGLLQRSPRLTCRALLAVQLALLIGTGGVYLANLRLVDSPFGPWTRAAYLATALTALLAIAASGAWSRALEQKVAKHGLLPIVGIWLLADGTVAGLLDSYGVRPEYPVHPLLGRLTVAGLTAGTLFCVRTRTTQRLRLTCWSLAAVAALALSFNRAPIYRVLANAPGAQGRVFTVARSLGDRDGDGFSAWFDGGDCDDRDPGAFPLSPDRDCLGWRTGPLPPRPALREVKAQAGAPRLILLLTIDAFRCGFESGGAEPLRSACPELTRIARQGWSRLDAHTTVPNTSSSLTILMTGNPQADALDFHRRRPTLPQRLHEAGYRNQVLVSFPLILKDRAVREGFDDVDLEHTTQHNSPFEGDALSTRLLERSQRALENPASRTFLWAHFPDPHFPFVVDDSPLKHTSIEDYAEIVRRTDAAIGRLLASLARHANASEILVLVTADHGEGFGEHGERYHGFNLHEEAVRIPIIAWCPGDPRRFESEPPPRSNASIGDYLLAAVQPPTTPAPPSDDSALLLRTVMADRQFGVLSDGWKLIYNQSRNTTKLFHVASDPSELTDLADREPQKVEELGRALGRLLAPVSFGKTAARNNHLRAKDSTASTADTTPAKGLPSPPN